MKKKTSSESLARSSVIPIKEFELDNGLKVILSKDDSIPSVAVNVCYHVGSKNEEPDKTGYAHLFEHLMFEGSKHVPPGEYDKIITYAGGDNNAYTTEDKTNYFLLLPAHQLELGLWLESDKMLQFAVTPESLMTQKNVVIEEKKQNCDNRPYGTVSLEFAPRLFKKSGYRWDTIGNMKHIENATIDDIRTFFEKYYVPNNAVLSIAGNIDIHKTENYVKKYFDDILPGNNSTEYKFDEESLTNEVKADIYDDVHLPAIFIGFRIPRENTREHFALEMLSEILAGGDSSRLYQNLVYENQLASEIGCYVDPKEFAGIFYIYAILMPSKEVHAVEEQIDLICNNIKAGSISKSELEKAKNRIETKYHFRNQFILSKADFLAHYKTFYNDAGLINSILSNYSKISLDEVNDSARNFLINKNRVALHYLPRKNYE